MKGKSIIIFSFLFVIGMTLVLSSVVQAEYPEEPVMLVVPFGPGGSTDIAARALSSVLPDYLGQPVGVENMAGGAGTIGVLDVVNATPNGYRLGVLPIGPVSMAPAREDVGYEPDELIHIAQFVTRVPILVGRADAPWDDLEALVADAKENPGDITFMCARTAIYSIMLSFQDMADIDLTHIPSQGDPDTVRAVLGGDVDLGIISGIPVVDAHIEEENMKAYSIFAEERQDIVAEVPTAKELGYDIVVPLWTGVQAPKDTPPEIVNKIEEAIADTVEDPAFVAMMERIQMDIEFLGQEAFTQRALDHFELFKEF